MNIIFDIGIYMIASSLIMVGYVWFKSFKHSRLGYDRISDSIDDVTEETKPAEKNLAA